MKTELALDASNNRPASKARVQDSGCVLLICKATQGTGFKDKTLAGHRKIAAQVGIPFGSYLFLEPSESGAAQADFYLAYARPKPADAPPIIDAETRHAGESFASVARVVEECARALEQKTSRTPILYASASFWQSLFAADPGLRRLPVWEAQYPGRIARWFPRLAQLRIRLRHGVSVVMWQFTESAAVAGEHYDESVLLVPLARLI